jgi:hypothetical protein
MGGFGCALGVRGSEPTHPACESPDLHLSSLPVQDVSFDSMHGSIPVFPDTFLSLTAHGRATEITERLYRCGGVENVLV